MPCSSRLWMLAALVATACADSSVDDASTSDSADHDDDDDGSPTGDPSSSASESETSSVTTTATTTLGTSSTDADTGETSSSVTSIDDTSSSSDDSTGEMPNEACVAGCMIEFGCQDTCECGTTWRSEDACVQWCDANLVEAELFSTFCRDAWEAMSACIGTLVCEEYQQFHNPEVPDYPCVAEADALAFECKGQ